MKLRVVGWTDYDSFEFETVDAGWAACAAVVDDIKAHGYLFSGRDHQECRGCAPVLNDGKARIFSQRGFGSIVAEAHGQTGRMDYARYAFEVNPKERSVPPRERWIEDFDTETDLNETFEISVSEGVLASAEEKGKIDIDDLPQLRYLEIGDVLVLRCGKKAAAYCVCELDRNRDISKEERLKLELDFYAFDDKERMQRAEDHFNSLKIVLTVELKKL